MRTRAAFFFQLDEYLRVVWVDKRRIKIVEYRDLEYNEEMLQKWSKNNVEKLLQMSSKNFLFAIRPFSENSN